MKKGLSKILVQLLLILLFISSAHAEFGLMLGSFRNRDGAQKYFSSLADKDYKAFVQKIQTPDHGLWYRVCVGPFNTRTGALNQRKHMRSQGFSGDIVLVKTRMDNIVASKQTGGKIDVHTGGEKAVKPERLPAEPVQPGPVTRAEKEKAAGKRHITLQWDANKEPDIAGYKIFYNTDPNPPYDPDEADYADEGPSPVIVGSDVTEFTLHGLMDNKDYFFTITSFDKSGIESSYSTKVSTTQPIPPQTDFSRAPKPEHLPTTPRKTAPVSRLEKTAAFSTPAGSSEPMDKPTLITAGDILKTGVPGQREMSRVYDVDPNGNIYMILVGKIEAHGLDVDDLNARLTEKLGRYIDKGAKVSTEILERQRYIQITGGVRYPGWYHVPQLTSLDELIELAGGLIPGADYAGIRLNRMTPDGLMEIEIKAQIALQPNDILVVPFPETYRETVDNGDLLFISIPQRQAPGRRPDTRDSADLSESFTRNKVEVDQNGYVYVPDYGHIYVSGLTPEEIAKQTTDRLPKYMAVLGKVRVSIIEKRQFVQVLGHVTSPGWYNIPETANIQESLVAAGGAIDGAVMSEVSIQRRRGERIRAIKVNLYQYTITGDARLLTPIHENDILFVPISSSFGDIKRVLMAWSPPTERLEKDTKKKVRVFGAIHNPGFYEYVEDMDLLDLLVLASGETDDAELSNIVIIRNNRVAIRFNLTEWLDNSDDSVPLPEIQTGDTVYVNYVEVTVHEARERIFVIGKVKSPGSYELYPDMTVLQALAWAGGLDEWADSKNVIIVRMVDGKQENIRFNYNKGVSGKYPELNIRMEPNDTIIVP